MDAMGIEQIHSGDVESARYIGNFEETIYCNGEDSKRK